MGKLFSSMEGLMRGDILFISYDGEGVRATHTRNSHQERCGIIGWVLNIGGFSGAGDDGTPTTQHGRKKKAPEVTAVGFRDINFNTKKEGGHLLSRIALQYHRRSRA